MKHQRFPLVGMIIIFLLAGCAPAPVSTPPAPSPIFTPTHAPTPTITITPNAFSVDSVYTQTQQQRLAEIALSFIAGTESQAISVARALGYLPNEGHPASMCGPLAVAILQDAGLLDPAIDRHMFWKLNPRPDEDLPLLEETFPKERYDWYSFREPLDQFDFRAFPLQPGDFVYLYAGHGGSFEHVLTVTRVDGAGRAYAVTNLNTPQGYLIQELLLYDPTQPGIGVFYDWTNHDNWQIGLTGFGGFDVWRSKLPISDPTAAEQQLADSLEKVFTAAGGNWTMLFQKIDGEIYYERLGAQLIQPASAFSIPISMMYLDALEKNGVWGLYDYIDSHSLGNLSIEDTLFSMLTTFDTNATNAIIEWTTAHVNYVTLLESWGITNTTLSPRQTTAEDMSRMVAALYQGTMVSPVARQIIIDILHEPSPNKNTRLGVLGGPSGDEAVVYNQPGAIHNGPLVAGEVAILEVEGEAYVIALFAQSRVDGDTTSSKMEAAYPQVSEIIWGFLQSNP